MSLSDDVLGCAISKISHDEAHEILSRFNASHWNNDKEHARYSIPADPRRDDDLRMADYISQSRQLEVDLATALALLRIQDVESDWGAARRAFLARIDARKVTP
jgi:hypothetical protein